MNVYDFSLPIKNHLQTMFTVQYFYGGLAHFKKNYLSHWPQDVTPFGDSYKILIGNILRDFGEHRVTPELFQDQFEHLTVAQKKAYAERYGWRPPFSAGYNICLDYMNAEPLTDAKRTKIRAQLRARGQQLKDHGVQDLSFVKLGDEPTQDNLKYIRMSAEDARDVIPGIESFVALTHWMDGMESLYGLVDIWCVQWNRFDFLGAEALRRKEQGDGFWTYAAEYKSNRSYHPMDLRIPYWLYWKFGISGVHYSHHIPEFFLTYPNESYIRSDGLLPIPSIRWEMIRHGIQDYEYLWMLDSLICKHSQKGKKYIPLLTVPGELAENELQYTLDPEILLHRRKDIARAIEALSKTQ